MYDIAEQPQTKEIWKQTVRKAVHDHYLHIFKNEVLPQSSCRYLNLNTVSLYRPHHVWATVLPSSRDVTRALVKAKLLTGTYNLQAKRSKFKKNDSRFCPLCSESIETREHFIALCPTLHEIRTNYINQMKIVAQTTLPTVTFNSAFSTQNITQTILDPSSVTKDNSTIEQLESISRNMCYALHTARSTAINPDPSPGPIRRSSAAARPSGEAGMRLIQAE